MGISFLLENGKEIELRDLPNSPLPYRLETWFEHAKKIMDLPYVKCRYVLNEDAKKITNGRLIRVGAMGCAYNDDFAFIESDDGILSDMDTIVHEMLHLKNWYHCFPKNGTIEIDSEQRVSCSYDVYDNEVKRYVRLIEKFMV